MDNRKMAITQWSFLMEQLVSNKFVYHGKLVEPEPYDAEAYRQIQNKLWKDDAMINQSTYRYFLKLLATKNFKGLEAELDKLI